MTIKPGVQLRTMSPQILLAIIEADRILEGTAVVTSVSDGVHRAGSLHYVGMVLESDHIHVEYQPKVRAS